LFGRLCPVCWFPVAHGYENQRVQARLCFAGEHAAQYAGRINWLVVPCVSPAYERIQRWNWTPWTRTAPSVRQRGAELPR
jgi:hypothetical protein